MENNQVSRTAILAAYNRGFHAKYDTPKIFDDHLANYMVPEKAREIIEQGMISNYKLNHPESDTSHYDQAIAVSRSVQTGPSGSHTLCRPRYAEDALKEAVWQGVVSM